MSSPPTTKLSLLAKAENLIRPRKAVREGTRPEKPTRAFSTISQSQSLEQFDQAFITPIDFEMIHGLFAGIPHPFLLTQTALIVGN
jgi:hypothetical protein